MDKEALAQPPQPWEFRTKPAWQRLLIMTGGVLMNFILAFFIYAMIVLAWGEKYIPVENIKMGLSFNQATLKAGFQNGDIPIAADGISLKGADLNAETLWKLVEAKEVDVLRNNEIVRIQLPADFEKIIHDEEPNFINRYPFVVSVVSNGMPAQKAGLEKGDSIVGVNGERLAAHEIMQALALYKEQEIRLNIFRHGIERELLITPDNFGKIGVGLCSPYDIYETVERHYNFFTAFPAGIRIGWETTVGYLKGLSKIFSKEGAQSLGGFGTIASIFPGQWDWTAFWTMTAFLSIILGVMNLLPIPALDGGHVMFLLYEVVSGRKPNDKFMEHAQMVGMVLLLALLIYANGMDVFRAFFK
jgi:regulator of sigma E protease